MLNSIFIYHERIRERVAIYQINYQTSLERYRKSPWLHYRSFSACVVVFRRILRELAKLTKGSSLRLFTEDRYWLIPNCSPRPSSLVNSELCMQPRTLYPEFCSLRPSSIRYLRSIDSVNYAPVCYQILPTNKT